MSLGLSTIDCDFWHAAGAACSCPTPVSVLQGASVQGWTPSLSSLCCCDMVQYSSWTILCTAVPFCLDAIKSIRLLHCPCYVRLTISLLTRAPPFLCCVWGASTLCISVNTTNPTWDPWCVLTVSLLLLCLSPLQPPSCCSKLALLIIRLYLFVTLSWTEE